MSLVSSLFISNETLQSSLAKDCLSSSNANANQSIEPTESRDNPKVKNYPRKSVAPSAQSTALHVTITRYPMEASYK